MTSRQNESVNGVPVPQTTSNFTGDITVSGGTLVTGALAPLASIGSIGVLGSCSNTRTVTVNAGGTLDFLLPNIFGQFSATKVPAPVINGGLVTNMARARPHRNKLRGQ